MITDSETLQKEENLQYFSNKKIKIYDNIPVLIHTGLELESETNKFYEPIISEIKDEVGKMETHGGFVYSQHKNIIESDTVECSNEDENESIVADKIKQVYDKNKCTTIERGMDNEFDDDIAILAKRYGSLFISSFNRFIIEHGSKYDKDLLSEGLRVIANIEDKSTEEKRLELLISMLNHQSPIIRDEAALGLSDMNNKKAIIPLKTKIEKESYKFLKARYNQVINSIEENY